MSWDVVASFVAIAVCIPFAMMEVWEWIPRWSEKLARRQAQRLPAALSGRYREEWLADLQATPGHLAKLAIAADLFRAVPRVNHEMRYGDVPYRPWLNAAWRVASSVAGAMSLIAYAPIFGVIAGLLRLTGPNILELQASVGYRGRAFDLYRFRADRSTPLGRFLRRTSLHAMPIFINLLKGDLNLVGPMPLPRRLLAGGECFPQYAVRPGVIGPWVVHQRTLGVDVNAIDASRQTLIDVNYLNERSLLLDLLYLGSAVKLVIGSRADGS